MPKLNLLPPLEKKELELEAISYWLAFFCASLLMLVIVFTLLCFSSYLHLSILIGGQEKQIETAESDAKGQELIQIEEKINDINQKISKIDQLQHGFVCWTPILENISALVPNGIYLENLAFQAKNSEVKLSGHADLREQVIKLSERIEENSLFIDINDPLSNLISKEDINFTFDFKINTSTASCHFEG